MDSSGEYACTRVQYSNSIRNILIVIRTHMPTCYRPRRKAPKHRSTQSRIQDMPDMEWDPKFNFSFLQHHFTASGISASAQKVITISCLNNMHFWVKLSKYSRVLQHAPKFSTAVPGALHGGCTQVQCCLQSDTENVEN